MSITGIILAVAAVGGVGLFVGVFLGIAALKFKVEVDEKEEAVLAALPATTAADAVSQAVADLRPLLQRVRRQ